MKVHRRGPLGNAHPLSKNSAPAAGARGGGGGPADPGSAKSLSLSFTDPVPESLRGLKPPLRSNIFLWFQCFQCFQITEGSEAVEELFDHFGHPRGSVRAYRP